MTTGERSLRGGWRDRNYSFQYLTVECVRGEDLVDLLFFHPGRLLYTAAAAAARSLFHITIICIFF